MEVWKYWMQLWGFMPSDELQRLRAENELLKVQLEMAKAREHVLENIPDPFKPLLQEVWKAAKMEKRK